MEIFGHNKQRDSLRLLLESKKLAQTCLFYGADSVGKHLVALEVAGCLVSDGSSDSNLFQRIIGGAHPDVFSLKPTPPKSKKIQDDGEKAERNWSIKIEQVQELKSKLIHQPLESSRQVIIIDDADLLTTTAANSLLKLIEEPKPYQFFILVSSRFHKILPTIRSRSARFYFGSLAIDQVEKIIRSMIDPNLALSEFWFQFLYRAFQGSIHRIFQMVQSGLDMDFIDRVLKPNQTLGQVERITLALKEAEVSLSLVFQCVRQRIIEQNRSGINSIFLNSFEMLSKGDLYHSRHIPTDMILERVLMAS